MGEGGRGPVDPARWPGVSANDSSGTELWQGREGRAKEEEKCGDRVGK